ncbi:MAG: bifunctional isocitrate dehydrogenase kinase/phosphatase, partial [Gemmatimonadales bacterium]
MSPAVPAAKAIQAAFEAYHGRFHAVTRRARTRFEERDWAGVRADARERLTLYSVCVDTVVQQLAERLGTNLRNAFLWREMKAVHTRLTDGLKDEELARTFFNSITRRVFTTVGVDPTIEYLDLFAGDMDAEAPADLWTYRVAADPVATMVDLLSNLPFRPDFEDLSRDAARVAEVLTRAAVPLGIVERLEVLPPVFYRGKSAYVLARAWCGGRHCPLLLAFLHEEGGIVTDAALTSEDEVSIVFSFTRAYFHVEVDRPQALVAFLHAIMPRKPLDELYTAIGYNKHGKTILYRKIMQTLAADSRFEPAPGDKGLVMTVFALPALSLVLKIIKDRFGAPKATTRDAVRAKYHMVFVHDRVGRLADAQEFEYLEFERIWFEPSLLAELLRDAAETVHLEGERVIIRHLYTERQVRPLNLYLQSASAQAAHDAMIDYGNAIKELAAANIFTGDMLLKNFGVTRHGRVIFYDYDELTLLTDCNFRHLPAPRTEEEEMAAEPWYSVGERDVFPEEFRHFLVLPGPLGEAFLARHADLLTVEYWQQMQTLLAAGEL